jgi:hypothetical protein
MPRKLINKSRNVGSRKPGRPPKNQSPAKPGRPPNKQAPTSTESEKQPNDAVAVADTPPKQTTPTSAPATAPRQVSLVKPAQSYTGLSQVNNALTFPKFDPNSYFATDLFKDTSKLERTTKEDADALCQSIEEKRQTVRVATANIQLNQDVVKAGNEYLKLEGLAIDYATTGINNETKFVNYEVAGLNKQIALNKLDQANERLAQGQATLAGMQSITPLISQEWDARKSLKLSQISSLKIEATKAKEALEPKMTQLSQNFRQELEDLN